MTSLKRYGPTLGLFTQQPSKRAEIRVFFSFHQKMKLLPVFAFASAQAFSVLEVGKECVGSADGTLVTPCEGAQEWCNIPEGSTDFKGKVSLQQIFYEESRNIHVQLVIYFQVRMSSRLASCRRCNRVCRWNSHRMWRQECLCIRSSVYQQSMWLFQSCRKGSIAVRIDFSFLFSLRW